MHIILFIKKPNWSYLINKANKYVLVVEYYA